MATSLYARRLPQALALNAGMPLLTGGVFLIAASYATREFYQFDPHAIFVVSAAALVYLIIFGSIVAFSAYAWLMQVAPAARVGTHAYINPLIAVLLGCTVAGEPFTAAIATRRSSSPPAWRWCSRHDRVPYNPRRESGARRCCRNRHLRCADDRPLAAIAPRAGAGVVRRRPRVPDPAFKLKLISTGSGKR